MKRWDTDGRIEADDRYPQWLKLLADYCIRCAAWVAKLVRRG